MPSPSGRLAATTAAAATTSSGKNFHPSRSGRSWTPEEEPFEKSAAPVGGLTRELVEEVKGSVVVERACTEGPHISLIVLHGVPTIRRPPDRCRFLPWKIRIKVERPQRSEDVRP